MKERLISIQSVPVFDAMRICQIKDLTVVQGKPISI